MLSLYLKKKKKKLYVFSENAKSTHLYVLKLFHLYTCSLLCIPLFVVLTDKKKIAIGKLDRKVKTYFSSLHFLNVETTTTASTKTLI